MSSAARTVIASSPSTPRNEQAVLERLNGLIAEASRSNEFQRDRLDGVVLHSLGDLRQIRPIEKDDLLRDQLAHPPFGRNLTYPRERYVHLHQTSGTSGSTLRVLDTEEDWDWWRACFRDVFAAAGVGPTDLVALAYSFGPYIQFWASYEGAGAVGANRIALGGMDSVQRLETIREYRATTLACTPSYALRLAKVADERGLGDALSSVTKIICTGEPGASLSAVRSQIERLWGALCLDHAGLSEVGAFGYPCAEGGGVHINEREFVTEIVAPGSEDPVGAGEVGELIVTAIGRKGFPAIRYRTGDVVECCEHACPAGHSERWLPGGILGRTDDMVVIRGMNVFPSAIEQVLREFDELGEFRITFYNEPTAMDEVKVEVELARPSQGRAIQSRLRTRLGLRVRIVPLQRGILPVPSGKTRRVVDTRALPPRRLSPDRRSE
jgi:phenylacetate-CoA ligase